MISHERARLSAMGQELTSTVGLVCSDRTLACEISFQTNMQSNCVALRSCLIR